jgi:hypothetical protein
MAHENMHATVLIEKVERNEGTARKEDSGWESKVS